MLGGWRREEVPGTKNQGLGFGPGGRGFPEVKRLCEPTAQRDDGNFTIEKVTLAFQDLGHLLDPGLTDCRV